VAVAVALALAVGVLVWNPLPSCFLPRTAVLRGCCVL
jgi:hypothetical protein